MSMRSIPVTGLVRLESTRSISFHHVAGPLHSPVVEITYIIYSVHKLLLSPNTSTCLNLMVQELGASLRFQWGLSVTHGLAG